MASALRERDHLKQQLETTPTQATPTNQDDEISALKETVAQLQKEKATPTSSAVTVDIEKELEDKSVS